MELILEEIELFDNKIDDNLFNVFADTNGLIVAKEIGGNRTFNYKLKKEQNDIAREHREEILEYRLVRVTEEDEVSLGDIFMHGEHVELITQETY